MSTASFIREVQESDLSSLAELCREHAAFERADWVPFQREAGLKRLLLESDSARCWVVESGGGLVGFASASFEFSTWEARRFLHLDCLFLRAEFRGRGLGSSLFERVAAFAVEFGAANLQWQTPTWNSKAMRFYRRLGASSQKKVRFTLDPAGCAQLLKP